MNDKRSSGIGCRIGGRCIILGLVLLGGCGSIQVALGLKMRLDKIAVASLSAWLSPSPGLSPGKSGRLVITATADDGKQFVTVGPGHGKVLFDSFIFDATVVSVNKKGIVSLPEDPRVSEGTVPHIRITAIGHPDIAADLDIPVRYDAAFAAHFSGNEGSKGFDGMNGLDGSAGSSGSVDLTNPSAGGSGTNGTSGGNGDDGGPGQPGEAVHIWVTLAKDGDSLLQVHAASRKHEQFFLVDPNGGTLAVDANGGPGGRGGSGGKGGRGGAGGTGWPSGQSGLDGQNGFDGHSGSDGAAGTLIVSVDPAAQPYLDRLHFSNKSGGGRPGPAPTILVEPVPPIW